MIIIKRIESFINLLVTYTKYISMIAQVVMMLFIPLAVIMRNFDHSIVGDYEVVELLMVIIIMMGVPYVQKINNHISIGLIVDRLSDKAKKISNLVAFSLTFLVCALIGYVNILSSIDYYFSQRTSKLLELPLFPFVAVIGIGFIFWSLVALSMLVKTVGTFKQTEKIS